MYSVPIILNPQILTKGQVLQTAGGANVLFTGVETLRVSPNLDSIAENRCDFINTQCIFSNVKKIQFVCSVIHVKKIQ